MPIDSTRVERGIYHSRVSGRVSLSELAAAQDHLFALWREANDPPVIAVIDLSAADGAPDVDLNSDAMRAMVKRQFEAVRAYVVYGASAQAQKMIPVIATIMRVTVHHARDYDEAIAQARRLVE